MAQRGKKPPQFPGDFIALGAKPGKYIIFENWMWQDNSFSNSRCSYSETKGNGFNAKLCYFVRYGNMCS